MVFSTGIPEIEPLDIGGTVKVASRRNKALLWQAERPTKLDYDAVDMPRLGVPNHYKDKNARRIARLKKENAKKAHATLMKRERKQERLDERKIKHLEMKQLREKKRESRKKKEELIKRNAERAEKKEQKKKRKEQRQEKREAKMRRQKKREEKEARGKKCVKSKGKKNTK